MGERAIVPLTYTTYMSYRTYSMTSDAPLRRRAAGSSMSPRTTAKVLSHGGSCLRSVHALESEVVEVQDGRLGGH